MKIDKLVMLIGGIVLFIIFVFGMVTNYGSLYEPELSVMAVIMSGTLAVSVSFIYHAIQNKEGTT